MDPVTAALVSWATGQTATAATRGLKRLLVGDKQENALRAVVKESVSIAVDEVVTAPGSETVREALLRESPETVQVRGKDFRDLRSLVAARVTPRLEVLHEQGYAVDAELLTDALIKAVIAGIQADAMRGGLLTPLAEFLRHERVAVAGEQALDELKAMNQALSTALARVPPRDHAKGGLVGELISDAANPVALGVHEAIKTTPGELPELPPYVRRAHDDQLLCRIQELGQHSAMIVLVGNSSTGKTRALWEAVTPMPPSWRLWAPPDAGSLHIGLTGSVISPQTVLWLNDLVNYIDLAQGDMASGNATLLQDLIDRPTGPVLILATIWPEQWQFLTAQPRGLDQQQTSQNRKAAALLARAAYITVPDSFEGSDLESLRVAARHDPRLSVAMENASGGRITQYLAGAPMLLERYDTAPTEARAVIDAAIDARRLGHQAHLPEQLLLDAASGYIDEDTWGRLGDDWPTQALRTVTLDWRGLPGPLARIRLRPGEPADSHLQYRLADILEQTGARARRFNVPPGQFWMAVARHGTGDANTLAIAAEKRGLFRHAAILYRKEIAAGNASAAIRFLRLLDKMGMDSDQAAGWIAQHVSFDNVSDITRLLELMQKAGAKEAISMILTRLPIQDLRISPSFSWPDLELLRLLVKLGADNPAKSLAGRFAVEISLDDPSNVASLVGALHEFGAVEALRSLLARDPGAKVRLSEPWRAANLLVELREAGADNAVDALAWRLAREVPLDNPSGLVGLLKQFRGEEAADVADTLPLRVAHEVPLDNPSCVADLLEHLREAGEDEAVSALLARDPGSHAPLSELQSAADLLVQLRETGADNAADALAWRLARKSSLYDSSEIGPLVSALHRSGSTKALRVLLARDPARHISATGDPQAVRSFLETLSRLPEELHDARAKAGTALASHVAQQFPVNEPSDVTKMLIAMNWIPRAAGEFADRAARGMPFSSMDGVTDVLRHLRRMGMRRAIQLLIARDPAQHVRLGSPWSTSQFIDEMRAAGAENTEERVYGRCAREVSFNNIWKVAQLLQKLRTTGADEAMGLLLAREPAEHVSINYARTMPDDDIGDDRAGAAWLVLELRLADADESAMMLARRAAQDIAFERPDDIAYLLHELVQAKRNYRVGTRLHQEVDDALAILLARGPEWQIPFTETGEVNMLYMELRSAGAEQVASTLYRNALNVGLSSEYLALPTDDEDLFKYGREPDATPSRFWAFADLPY